MCISFSKKNICFILILLSLTITLQPFTVIANAEGTVEKIYCNATLEDDFAPNKVLVVTQNNGEFQAANNYFSDIEYTSITDISLSSSQSLTNDSQINEKRIFCLEFDFNSKARVLDVIDTLIEQDNVIYAGPDYYVEYDSTTPNDVLLSQQWAIDNMQLPLAWDITTGSSNLVVGVMDPSFVNQATYYTPNGSYVLPNGVIVLVDADIAAYMQGTLQFLCRGEVAA